MLRVQKDEAKLLNDSWISRAIEFYFKSI